MPQTPCYYRVAVPVPLSRHFDYLPPSDNPPLPEPGTRVLVPFGRGQRVAIFLGTTHETDVPENKLKAVSAVLDDEPCFDDAMLELLQWAARYYVHPLGEVFAQALPAALREPQQSLVRWTRAWQLTAAGLSAPVGATARAPVQSKLRQHLREQGASDAESLSQCGKSWRDALKKLSERGWVEETQLAAAPPPCSASREKPLPLNAEQQLAVDTVKRELGSFSPCLLDGITGSGKTEVYLHLVQHCLDLGQQVLVLVPEIGLTPQLMARFNNRFDVPVVSLHSGLVDGARLKHWQWAQRGEARVVIGTRSAVFTPLPDLGLIIIDEEHDGSLKQQDSLRYHGRDLALVRARAAQIPLVLGTATPSLETLKNARDGKYKHLKLRERAGDATPPSIELLDIRRSQLHEGLSQRLLDAMREPLSKGQQVLIFLNRRGFAPVLMCESCGEACDCKRCDAHMTWHRSDGQLHCHHCGSQRPLPHVCEHCGEPTLSQVGQGTQRIEDELRSQFPNHRVLRVDRDNTQRKGALAESLEIAHRGDADILVGTQMLAKGHHFPKVTLVGVLDMDGGLYRVDYRAAEVMGQTLVQVAGRAGRAADKGKVVIQTRLPDNPLLLTLVQGGYTPFADALLSDRNMSHWPPYCRLAIVRAESTTPGAGLALLESVYASLSKEPTLQCAPPGPA
ncbi:MAG: primosomal protein N', partial [Granulosicoccaceae bacterium]